MEDHLDIAKGPVKSPLKTFDRAMGITNQTDFHASFSPRVAPLFRRCPSGITVNIS
jgi:hypothetical protein